MQIGLDRFPTFTIALFFLVSDLLPPSVDCGRQLPPEEALGFIPEEALGFIPEEALGFIPEEALGLFQKKRENAIKKAKGKFAFGFDFVLFC
ncbi:MAG: hypothetical protein RR229_06070 [Oscillospiraceae bacterium]